MFVRECLGLADDGPGSCHGVSGVSKEVVHFVLEYLAVVTGQEPLTSEGGTC